jgi:hypothetical protein
MKKFLIQHNIGHAKYVVSYHDGIKKYDDGSDFYDIRIFKNKKILNTFVAGLKNDGYTE